MSYPNPSLWMSISTSSATSPFMGVSSLSIPDHHVPIQEGSVQRNQLTYHLDTGMTIPIREGQPLGFEARTETSHTVDPYKWVSRTWHPRGAHHLTFNNPIMVANDRADIEREMLKLLEKKAMVDGTYNSAARHYTAPRCHPNTCIPLRERLIKWLLDVDWEESLFWLYGPAGVGKSAIAQNIMEYCTEQGFPGAGLFLSRANKCNDPSRIIPSLAHQLALPYPAYRRRISNALSTDSTILEKRLPLQFCQLIDEAVDVLKIKPCKIKHHPILLLLDGLDECNTHEAQHEVIEMLASFASACKAQRLPFICIVTSRLEWQIVSTFDALGPATAVWQEELPMDTPEARQDVSLVLRDGFEDIKSKHSDSFLPGVEWPTHTDLQTIKSAASSNMLFASLVVTCVDDNDPTTQLELCLKFLQGKLASNEQNPFDSLAALYRGLLLSIPPTLLRTALLILYFQLLVDDDPGSATYGSWIPVQAIANFLFIRQAAFYGSLKRLCPVLSIPLPANASHEGLAFSHTTFTDYVKVAVQAGHFRLHEVDALEVIWAGCIKWHHILLERGANADFSDIVSWPGPGKDTVRTFRRVLLFKLWHDLLRRGSIGELQEELESFLFKDLPRNFTCSCETDGDLMRLAHDLVTNRIRSATGTCIMRTLPVWPTDHQLINKYVAMFGQWAAEVKPLDWGSIPMSVWDDVELWFCSVEDSFDNTKAFDIIRQIHWRPTLAYFLLGHDQNTIFVIAYPYGMDLHVYWKEALERIKALCPIASTKDNPWPEIPEQSPLYSLFCSKQSHLYDIEFDGQSHKIFSYSDLPCNIISFVADPWHRNPHSRLKIVIDILSFTSNPTEILHHLCRHVLGDIPHGTSHTVHQVLAFLIILNSQRWSRVHLKDLKRFTCLDSATINFALQWLHPLVFLWRPKTLDPDMGYLQLRHPCMDRRRSNISYNLLQKDPGCEPWYCLEEQAWVAVFGWWTRWSSWCLATGHHPLPSSEIDDLGFLGRTWIALREIHTPDGLAAAAAHLCDFPFYHLDQDLFHYAYSAHDFVRGFEELILRLSSDSAFSPLIRNQPICQMDYLLLEKWAKFGHGSEFTTLPIDDLPSSTRYYPISLSTTEIPPPMADEGYRIFLIGYGDNTCLMAMTPCDIDYKVVELSDDAENEENAQRTLELEHCASRNMTDTVDVILYPPHVIQHVFQEYDPRVLARAQRQNNRN
ncbi:hypothetical protein D9756_010148 [Leucocoprinus leucothites]|uniref:Nephrocystin 3-like N-terminal domain-containing protein n=1 Tax=Leucocoprinus leucothites TaxID=201217 RepID=A0A8H5FTA3_9AGAR|nr:hypothetical protein D9756_010148 [Leucoagaricus leucothites]